MHVIMSERGTRRNLPVAKEIVSANGGKVLQFAQGAQDLARVSIVLARVWLHIRHFSRMMTIGLGRVHATRDVARRAMVQEGTWKDAKISTCRASHLVPSGQRVGAEHDQNVP